MHQLASPDPSFDPSAELAALVTTIVGPHRAESPALTEAPTSPVILDRDQLAGHRCTAAEPDDQLEQLSEQEWRQPSLCEGWTVRDVAAHLTLQQLGAIAMTLRYRGKLSGRSTTPPANAPRSCRSGG